MTAVIITVENRGSQVEQYKEGESLQQDEVGVDGWVKQAQDFHFGDRCSWAMWDQKMNCKLF